MEIYDVWRTSWPWWRPAPSLPRRSAWASRRPWSASRLPGWGCRLGPRSWFAPPARCRRPRLGQAFYLRCALIMRETEHAFDDLADTSAEPSGMLRLTAPFDYGVGVVVSAIAAFTQRYPACKVDAVHQGDQTLDIMAGNIELAIRVGWLAETSLRARKIGSFRQLLVASPTMAPQVARAHPSGRHCQSPVRRQHCLA